MTARYLLIDDGLPINANLYPVIHPVQHLGIEPCGLVVDPREADYLEWFYGEQFS